MKHITRILTLALCTLMILSLIPMSFAASNVTASMSGEVQEGKTITMTVSMSNATVSSIGVTIYCDSAFEIVSAKWLQSGAIANYDAANKKGAFAPGTATAISGNIFEVTVKGKTASSNNAKVTINVIAKNGSDVVFEQSVSKTAKVTCANHNFGAYTGTASEHSRTCSKCGYIEKTSHKWDAGKVTTAATCSQNGVKTYTCSVCSKTKTESIPKLNHTYGSWTKVDDKTHSKKCSCGDTLTASHTWDEGKVTTASTCGQPGTKTYTCKECKATKTESVAKIEHTYTNSCDNSCNICGAKRDTSHKYSTKWSTSSSEHWHECSVCGDKRDAAKHTESDWIVDKEATIHANGSKHIECTICKAIVKTERIPKLDCKHPNSKIEGIKGATCTEAGYTGDNTCTECGTIIEPGQVIPATGHDMEVTDAREATCTAVGYTGDTTCKVCGITERGQDIPKTEHNFVDGTCSCGATEQIESSEPEESIDADISYDNSLPDENKPSSLPIILGVLVAVAALGAGIVFFIIWRKRGDNSDSEIEE